MAAGVAARGFVVNGGDQADGLDSFGSRCVANTGTLSRLIGDGAGIVAGGADVAAQVNEALGRLFARVGGENEAAFAIEHADSVDAFFVGDGLHDVVGGSPIVVEHELPRGAGDAAGEFVGAEHHRVDQLLLLRPEIQVSAHAADGDDENREGQDQLGAEFARHNSQVAKGRGAASVRPPETPNQAISHVSQRWREGKPP